MNVLLLLLLEIMLSVTNTSLNYGVRCALIAYRGHDLKAVGLLSYFSLIYRMRSCAPRDAI